MKTNVNDTCRFRGMVLNRVMIIGICLFAISVTGSVSAGEKVLHFNIGVDGFPPFMILSENEPPTGIMVIIFEKICKKLGYKVVMNEIPRKRVEAWLKSGRLDVTPRCKTWTTNPEDFTFTDPVVHCREVLFVMKDSSITSIEDLCGKRLGTRLGYYHKQLESYFHGNKIYRVDAATESGLFKMLLYGRLEAVSCAELAGLWVIKQNNWQRKFRKIEQEVSSGGYCFMFSKKREDLVPVFNKELGEMRQKGEIQTILANYR